MCSLLQQFGPILDVEIIFNERGSKVRISYCVLNFALLFWSFLLNAVTISNDDIHIYLYILDQYRHLCSIFVYLHLNEFIRAYIIIILIFLELNSLKMLQILAFHSSFLNYLNRMLIDSEIIISVKPWRFV